MTCDLLLAVKQFRATDLVILIAVAGAMLGLVRFAQTAQAADSFDVVVYGGTPGGITAAVAAARQGASVVLLEEKDHIGGLNTSGLNNSEATHLNLRTLSGVAQEFYAAISAHYGKTGHVNKWESSAAQRIFDGLVAAEKNITLRFRQRVGEVVKENGRITALKMLDGSVVTGKVFVDASYEGDVMARAGVKYIVGRESRQTYGEDLAGIRFVDEPIKASPYDDEGKLLPAFTAPEGLVEGAGDGRVMNYNFRLTFTRRKDIFVPIPRPENYDPGRFVFLARYLKNRPQTRLPELLDLYELPNGKFEVNNKQAAIISIGHFGANVDYPDADYARRDAIWQDHRDYTQGFLYFLGHDESVPEPLRKEMLSWGLCKDELARPRKLAVVPLHPRGAADGRRLCHDTEGPAYRVDQARFGGPGLALDRLTSRAARGGVEDRIPQ